MNGDPITARAWVAASPEDLYALLADLREHWRLAGGWVEALALEDDRGVVRVRGPLGLARTVHTQVVQADEPALLAGEARLGATRARVCWTLDADGPGTWVTLSAELLEAGLADRALLALGGRRWLRGRFAATVLRLGENVTKSSSAPLRVAVG